MTTPASERAEMAGHELLLRMAGRIPDQALAQARRILADGAASSAITVVASLVTQSDEALVAPAEAHSAGLAGIWRSWRYVTPAAGHVAGPPRPHRVYIVQVEDPAMIPGLAADLLGAVPDSAGAGIEIITIGEEPPAYQRSALAESRLLWATVTAPEFEIARVFDFADPVTGPGFAPGAIR